MVLSFKELGITRGAQTFAYNSLFCHIYSTVDLSLSLIFFLNLLHRYKRTYKVQQDMCFREICEPVLHKKNPSKYPLDKLPDLDLMLLACVRFYD